MSEKLNKQKTTIFILVILLILAVGYIVAEKYQATKQREQITIFQQGMQAGYQQAVINLIQQLSTCNQIPLFAGNTTINAVAVECLR